MSRIIETFNCTECGMPCPNAVSYHPWLYCELFKLGHRDPEAYLAEYGFTRGETP